MEGGDHEVPVEDPDPDVQEGSGDQQEVRTLRALLTEESIVLRGQKAMQRSRRKKQEKQDKNRKYINKYR